MSRVAIVLAAGKGTRMKSDLPKVLIPVLGRPMLDYVLDALSACGIDRILVVVGYRRELVEQTIRHRPQAVPVTQAEQMGTGHAVRVCREQLVGHQGAVLVVTGDSPLIQSDSINQLLAEYDRTQPACLLGTAHKDNPAGLGRIVRDAEGNFQAIVEEKDASQEERKITEVNLSCYVFDCQELFYALDHVRADNRQREYYLTDCPGILKAAGRSVRALPVLKPIETLSINTFEELAVVEQALQSLSLTRASNRGTTPTYERP